MANVLAPFGFRPIRRRDGTGWNGTLSTRFIANAYATTVYRGDLLQSLSTGYVQRCAAGQATCAGIFMGCHYFDNNQGKIIHANRYPASVSATGDIRVDIIDDPDCVFEAQVSGASPVAFANIGENIDILATAGDDLSGISKETVAFGTLGVTATLPFRVVQQSNAVDNDNTTANNRIWVVGNTFDILARLGV